MKAYWIEYHIRGKDRVYELSIDAKDLQSAKRKIGRKHKYKDGRMVVVTDYTIVGYY